VNVFEAHVDQLRVPVKRTRVEVRTERGSRPAVIFLAPECALQDVFEEDAPFFPAEEGGRIRLYARSSVVSLVVEAGDVAAESLAALGVPNQVRSITVHLRGGDVVTGVVMSLSGPTRTLDILNQAARSFAVHAEGRIHHVAKAHVEHIEELR
jgi:hypothetical protein